MSSEDNVYVDRLERFHTAEPPVPLSPSTPAVSATEVDGADLALSSGRDADVTTDLTIDVHDAADQESRDHTEALSQVEGEVNYVASERTAASPSHGPSADHGPSTDHHGPSVDHGESWVTSEVETLTVSQSSINGHHKVRFGVQATLEQGQPQPVPAQPEDQGRPQLPTVSEARSYFSPGSMIRAQALEELRHPPSSPPSATPTSPSYTSSLVLQRQRDLDLETGSQSRILSTATFPVQARDSTSHLTASAPSTSASPTSESTTSELSASHPTTSAPLEIERKFSLAPNTEGLLVSLGARLLSSTTFEDVYWDTDDFSLSLADWWLRQRNGRWQLKYPAPGSPASQFSTQYLEEDNEQTIAALLAKKLSGVPMVKPSCVTDVIVFAGLTSLASITTHRKRYGLPDCSVDIDVTDSGFQVGEIEVMAAGPDRVLHALQTIDSMATQLGMSPLCLNAIQV